MEKVLEKEPKKIDRIINLVAYITIVLFTILQMAILTNFRERLISITVMALFAIIWKFWLPKVEGNKFYINLFIFVEAIIIVIPVILGINWGIFAYLFFVLSVFAMMQLPLKIGIIWIIIFSIICFVVYTLLGGLYNGILYALLYGVGSFFFGGFGYALSIAIESRKKSEKLLKELSYANEKLKEYAEKVEQLAILEERNRLSREMHDSIGHHLVTVSLQIEILKKIINENPDGAKNLIDLIKNEISVSLEELRNVVKTLRKPVEFDVPIQESIKNIVEKYNRLKNIKINLEIDENIKDLPSDYKITFIRVCQEALTNIEKHSKASEVWIKLEKLENEFKLKIEDNGIGFPNEFKEGSFGLTGIKERANILNGKVSFENRKEGGAKIVFSLPID